MKKEEEERKKEKKKEKLETDRHRSIHADLPTASVGNAAVGGAPPTSVTAVWRGNAASPTSGSGENLSSADYTFDWKEPFAR